MSLFSIIVPVFNTEKYLAKCLDSILSQTFQDFELIIVNDCSKGNCEEIVEKYQKKYTNIRYIKNSVNEGLFRTRMIGVKNSSHSKYIMHVDSDDYLINENVLLELSKECENDYDIVTFNNILEYSCGKRCSSPQHNNIVENKILNNTQALYELYRGCLSNNVITKIIKKEIYNLINNIDIHLTFLEDYLCIVPLLYYSNSIKLITNQYYVYYQRENSATKFTNMSMNAKKKMLNDLIYVFENVKAFFIEKGLYNEFELLLTEREKEYYYWIYTDIIKNTTEEEKKELDELVKKAFSSIFIYYEILENIDKSKYIKNTRFISIIIPVYNTEKYLRRCLDSIVKQSFKDFEIIIVDDCSPGNCREIVEEYKGYNIKYIKNKNNMGSAWSRINGLSFATGKYVHFVDSDDWLADGCYEKIYKYLQNKYEVLHFNGMYANDNTSWKMYFHIADNNILYGKRAAFDDMFFDDKRKRTLWCRVFDRKLALKGVKHMPKEHISIADDWILNLFILFYVKKYKSVSDVFYYYYQGNPNAVSNVHENKAVVIVTSQKLNNITKQVFWAHRSVCDFFKYHKIWHLYRAVWVLYIERDMKYLFIDCLSNYEKYIVTLAESNKEEYIKDTLDFFSGYVKPSSILNFLREQMFNSNDFSEYKLWQLSRTNWFYKLTSKLTRPRMFFNNLFSSVSSEDKVCFRIFGFKICLKNK